MKKRSIFVVLSLVLAFAFMSQQVHAAPNCSTSGGYGDMTDPACYTSSTVTCSWEKMGVTCNDYHPDGCNVYTPGTTEYALCVWGEPIELWNPSYSCPDNNWRPCPDGTPNRWCHADWYRNTCTYERFCTNDGALPSPGTQTTYTCHYIDSVTSWGACVGNQQLATAVHWTTTSGTSCSNVPLQRYCCPTPTSDVSVNGTTAGPVTVDAETDFTVGWEFTNTDLANGYTCNLINTPNNYDVLLTPSPYAVNYGSTLGLLTGSLTGNVVFAGPSASYLHNYEFSCSHTEAGCPATSDNIDVSVTPLPFQAWLTVNDGTSDLTDGSNAQVTDWLRFTVDVEGGVPSDVDNQYAVSWQWFVDGAPHSSHTGRTATIGSEEHTDYHDKRFGVEGATVGATVTITDLWAPAPGHTIVRTFGLTMVDDRNPQ